MFSAEYQSGSRGLEILTPAGSGKDEKWFKFVGGVKREYSRDVKGYMYVMDKASTSTCIQCPASSRCSLGITQPLLVVQLQSFAESNLSIEVVILDHVGRRHRLRFSNNLRRFESNNLHAQIPWYVGDVALDRWTQVVFDLEFLTDRCFEGACFTSLDSFCFRPSMKVRNVFTLPLSAAKKQRREDEGSYDRISSISVPKSLHFSPGVVYETKFFDDSIDYALIPAPIPTSPRGAANKGATKGAKCTSRGQKLSITGTTVPKMKKTSTAGGMNAVRDSTELKKVKKEKDADAIESNKPGKAVTASRREKTAAKIKLMKEKQEEEKLKLEKQYRNEITSQPSPSHADAKRKVSAIRRKKQENSTRRLNEGGEGAPTSTQGSLYEVLEGTTPQHSPNRDISVRKRPTERYPNKTRPIPIRPKRQEPNFSDSISETPDPSEGEDDEETEEEREKENASHLVDNVEEEILVMASAVPPNNDNPWRTVKKSTPMPEQHEEQVPSVFSRMHDTTSMTVGVDPQWVASVTGKLHTLTSELSIAEKEYAMEFGEEV